MKKLFLLPALLVISLLQAVADDGNIVKVSTAEEFVAAAEANKNIVLTADIDLTKQTTYGTTFTGSIDGLGENDKGEAVIYKIYRKDKASHSAQLFGGMSNATVKNVIFENFGVSKWHTHQGLFGNTINDCTFENVAMIAVSSYNFLNYAGIFAGEAKNCSFTNIYVMNCNVTTDGIYAGAFVGGSSLCTYTQCLINTHTWVYCDGSSFGNKSNGGGFCGKSYFDTFTECVNMGVVAANDDNAGGFAGISEGSNFYSCYNMGHICQTNKDNLTDHIGGIQKQLDEMFGGNESFTDGELWTAFFGDEKLSGGGLPNGMFEFPHVKQLVSEFMTAVESIAYVNLAIMAITKGLTSHDVLGGFCGKAKSGEFNCCSNYGTCNGRDKCVGGLVGEADRLNKHTQGVTFNNCFNAGYVTGQSHLGGIVGKIKYSDLRNCLNVGKVECIKEDAGSPSPDLNKWGPVCGNKPAAESSTYSNNFFLQDVCVGDYALDGEEALYGGSKVTYDDALSGRLALWINAGKSDGPWHQNLEGEDADPYPTLYADRNTVKPEDMKGCITISSADDLYAFAGTVNNRTEKSQAFTVYLTNDITLTGSEGDWIPIGTKDNPFHGFFYGNGFTIDRLTCRVEDSDAGLFGTVGARSEIYDVTIGHNSSIISTKHAVGGIVGCVRESDGTTGNVKIIGCGNNATVQGTYNVGGILGAVYLDYDLQLEIRDCYNAGTIYATSQGEGKTGTGESGLICGAVKANSTITDCWNIGNVLVAKGTSEITSAYVGGRFFVGYGGSSAPTVSHCYNMLSDLGEQTGVEHFTLTDLSNGNLCYWLNNKNNNTSNDLRWEMELGNTTTLCYTGYDSHGRGLYHSRTTSNPIGTIVLPYDVESNDSITYYELLGAVTPGMLSFQSVDVLCAGVPGLFQIHTDTDIEEEPVTYDFLSTWDEFNLSEKDLTIYENGDCTMYGTYSGVTITDAATLAKTYYISGGEVRQATKSLTVSPFRAYIQCETGVGANGLRVSLDGHTTDIVLLPAAPSAASDADAEVVYDLQGRRAIYPQQGIYIQNGKKFLVK